MIGHCDSLPYQLSYIIGLFDRSKYYVMMPPIWTDYVVDGYICMHSCCCLRACMTSMCMHVRIAWCACHTCESVCMRKCHALTFVHTFAHTFVHTFVPIHTWMCMSLYIPSWTWSHAYMTSLYWFMAKLSPVGPRIHGTASNLCTERNSWRPNSKITHWALLKNPRFRAAASEKHWGNGR